MADAKTVTGVRYSPAMDEKTHEQTYRGFVRFVEIGTFVVICWVLALAVGGIREAWLTAIFGVLLSGVAGTVEVSLQNMQGQTLLSTAIQPNQMAQTINLVPYAAGTYVLRIKSSAGTFSRKIVNQ